MLRAPGRFVAVLVLIAAGGLGAPTPADAAPTGGPYVGATVTGIVVGAGVGAPQQQVPVFAYRQGDGPSEPVIGYTDYDGRFAIDRLIPGRYRLGVGSDRDSLALDAADGPSFTVRQGQVVTGVRAVVQPAPTLVGTVEDAAGQPVEGLEVYASGAAELDPDNLPTTDAQGRFSLRITYGLDAVRVSIRGPGYRQTNYGGDGQPGTTALALAPGQTKRLTYHLQPAGSLSGTVVRSDTGTPVSGATVMVGDDYSLGIDTTDAQGRWEIGNLPAGPTPCPPSPTPTARRLAASRSLCPSSAAPTPPRRSWSTPRPTSPVASWDLTGSRRRAATCSPTSCPAV